MYVVETVRRGRPSCYGFHCETLLRLIKKIWVAENIDGYALVCVCV